MTNSEHIALASVSIAVIALVFSIWQGYLMRKHNRLSVVPLLHFDCGIADDVFFLKLKNAGVGPAVVKSLEIRFHDAKLVGSLHHITDKLVDELEIGHLGATVYRPGENQAIAAGNEYEILKIQNVTSDLETKDRFLDNLELLTINIRYTSIYGEKYNLSGPDS
jgi:hypothetical protein